MPENIGPIPLWRVLEIIPLGEPSVVAQVVVLVREDNQRSLTLCGQPPGTFEKGKVYRLIVQEMGS